MAGGSQARFHTLMDPEVIEEARYEALNRSRAMSGVLSGFILKPFVAAAAKLTGRFYYSRDHGPYLTFVEEVLRAFYAANVGQAIWKTMKQSISTAFIATDGAGSAAADALANQWARGTRVRRLVVLAHSAGSFYACEFLKHAAVRLPPTVQFDVIFVAPACDFTTFASTIQMLKPRISRFRHFAMSDALERADHLLKGIPSAFPASLLYLVSGVLEVESDTPLVGMERFYSDEAAYRQEPYDVVAEYVQPRTAWSRRNVGDFMTLTGPCEMTSHGGFYNEPATMNSIRQLLRTLR
jgi:hypothetical protein